MRPYGRERSAGHRPASLGRAVERDHDSVQHALRAAVDGSDGAGAGRSEAHPRLGPILEQGLTERDALALLDAQHGLHARMIARQQCDGAHVPGVDLGSRRSAQRDVEPAPDVELESLHGGTIGSVSAREKRFCGKHLWARRAASIEIRSIVRD